MNATKVKKPKAPDDSTLQKLWRKVVREEWNHACAFHSLEECEGVLECHHVIRRGRPHLRHSPANGILLCKFHHDGVSGYAGELASAVGEDKMEWLRGMQRKLFPDYLIERGQTRAEYFLSQKAYLTALLNGGAK